MHREYLQCTRTCLQCIRTCLWTYTAFCHSLHTFSKPADRCQNLMTSSSRDNDVTFGRLLRRVFRRAREEVYNAGQHVRLGQVEERVEHVDAAVIQKHEPVGILLADVLSKRENK